MLKEIFARAVYNLTGWCMHVPRMGHREAGSGFTVFTSCKICSRELK